ncbi:hypothetical protein MCERH10_02816 [Caulobacteraceae bacterium]|eukprot:gene51448-62916_t
MAKAHVSLVRAAARGDVGGQLPIPSGVPIASTVAALITTTTAWGVLAAGVNSPGRTTPASEELLPLANEAAGAAWIVTASGGPLLVTVAPPSATPTDPTYPTYLIMSGMSRDIGCGGVGHRLWARDVVL